MAMASYGQPALPRRAARARPRRRATAASRAEPVDLGALRAARCADGDEWTAAHADLACDACSAARGGRCSTSRAGCTSAPATATLDDGRRRRAQLRRQLAPLARGPVRARLGAARRRRRGHRARRRAARRARRSATRSRRCRRRRSAAAGPTTSSPAWLRAARRRATSAPTTSPTRSAEVLAADGVVAWFQGRSEFGPRALGHRSLLADPRRAGEPRAAQRRQGPRAVPAGRADGARRARARRSSTGPLPEPVHALHPRRARRRGATGSPPSCTSTGRPAIQTVDRARGAAGGARCSSAFEAPHRRARSSSTRRLNTAGRPMVDDPRDALECFGSAPVDALAIGPVPASAGRPYIRGSPPRHGTPLSRRAEAVDQARLVLGNARQRAALARDPPRTAHRRERGLRRRGAGGRENRRRAAQGDARRRSHAVHRSLRAARARRPGRGPGPALRVMMRDHVGARRATSLPGRGRGQGGSPRPRSRSAVKAADLDNRVAADDRPARDKSEHAGAGEAVPRREAGGGPMSAHTGSRASPGPTSTRAAATARRGTLCRTATARGSAPGAHHESSSQSATYGTSTARRPMFRAAAPRFHRSRGGPSRGSGPGLPRACRRASRCRRRARTAARAARPDARALP